MVYSVKCIGSITVFGRVSLYSVSSVVQYQTDFYVVCKYSMSKALLYVLVI